MIRPKSAPVYKPIDLKLGIKSSLPSVKPTLALLILIWETQGKPSTLEYTDQIGDEIVLKPVIETSLFGKLAELTESVSAEQLHEVINNNYMLKAQLETLIVAFELIWKVAKIRFSDNRGNGAERTGGIRYPKTLWYTANMDLLDEMISKKLAEFMNTLFAWLGVDIEKDADAEKALVRFLTVISEGAVYKLIDGTDDVVFNMESLYDTLLENDDAVDIAGDKEAKGSLRILKSAFSEGLFNNLSYQGNCVSALDKESLKHYSERVAMLHQLTSGLVSPEQTIPNGAVENEDVETIEPQYLSPAWFRLKATKYPQVDAEANALYQQFQSMYSVEKLRNLTDDELLGYIFLGVNDTSLCNALEFDGQYTQFGSIAGGTAYKYNLFYSKNEQTWKTSFGEGGQRCVSETEALEIGKQIRDALVRGTEVIANCETLSTANDYGNLLVELNAVIPQHITKMWFLKYYHMMFPHILPNFYNEAWQKHILCNLNIIPSDVQFVRMGQIACFVNECSISSIVFSKIIFDSIGSPKIFYRIGTGNNGTYFDEWHRDNYVAIGWNELGDLATAYQEDADSKQIITDALKGHWNYDNRLASRKYGEINNFYSAVADITYVVAMSGQKILAIGTLTGGYYFDAEKEYSHCRPVRWLKVFGESKALPVESEGKLTTFYELKNSENICYLYTLLHGNEEAAVADEVCTTEDVDPIRFKTGYINDYPRNRILFGAPGTGKSFTLNREKDTLLANGGEYERVTFHPDYSYANFVGTYKPVPCKDSDGKDAITYAYIPGPFMRTYAKALLNSRTNDPKPFLLVIEEINRANVAAVFGDVFQLLDRGDDEVSEYPIQATEDIKKYLAGELGGNPEDYAEIRIPDNMFLWATMNSADQGVFPMDTAFKRRWDFTYLGIDDSEAGIIGKKVILGQGDYRRIVEWNVLRKAINRELLTYKVNEDKLMGPYFISKKNLPEGEMIDPVAFTRIFKNKVIMYLFDDAAKQKRITLFGGCGEKAKNQYSKICKEFDAKGVYIFCEVISSQFIDNVPEDDGK